MEKILEYVYRSERIKRLLNIVSLVSVIIFLLSFLALAVFSFISGVILGIKMLVFMAVPFLLVTAARKLINAKRPYEIYDFYSENPKEKSGEGFPSRHVFSAFLIATLSYTVSLFLAIPLALVGALLALSRVFLGIHFPRDVIAGAIVGILSGVLGILLLSL